MAEKVLLVDDTREVLDTWVRLLTSPVTASERGGAPEFTIDTADDPEQALALLQTAGPYAVLISDLRMPTMNGLELLARARALDLASVRIIATGFADVSTAIDALNSGCVFRLLTKPCKPTVFASAVVDGLKQHQLVLAERQLLERTVGGIVQVLTELLELLSPEASSRSQRIRRYVQHMVLKLGLANPWELEIAAMLSHLGRLTLPRESIGADHDEQTIPEELRRAIESHPALAEALLAHIPRFETVAAIIGRQREVMNPSEAAVPLNDRNRIRLGGQILHVAMAFDAAVVAGLSRRESITRLSQPPARFDPILVDSLSDVDFPSLTFETRTVRMIDLRPGMILDEDLESDNGHLLMRRGQEITVSLCARLKVLASKKALVTKVRVLAPSVTLNAPNGAHAG